MKDPKRRLIVALYRGMIRWSRDAGDNVPFDQLSKATTISISPDLARGLTLKEIIRQGFRKQLSTEDERQQRISIGIQTLKELNNIKAQMQINLQTNHSASESDSNSIMMVIPDENQQQQQYKKDRGTSDATDESWAQELIDQISWLPAVSSSSQSDPAASLSASNASNEHPPCETFPLFPLTSTVYDPLAPALPLFAQIQDIPLPGAEIPLKIFEPRYRQMYDDILASGRRKFVVPFAHPTIPAMYASFGLLYEIVQIREVADQTNGVIQYLCHHIVTKPVHMHRMLNPEVWTTQETYLKVLGRVTHDDFPSSVDLKPIHDTILGWRSKEGKTRTPVAEGALNALNNEGFWGFVNWWIRYCQQELLDLQVGIAAEARIRTQSTRSKQPDLAVIAELQRNHRRRLLFLTLNLSLVVPTLLGFDSETKVEYLVSLLQTEREHQDAAQLPVDDGA